ncbi:MAG: hypothetical protein A3A51_02580 [Candidatus Levybacteria bacterium RIFCSPLOWO2_01_FULL_39_10]|nr:MAG: hypothetical protein A3A51_02580 [Candidatus Levybacteria bacterium RIFCSPLOWO2_01_FULL_39_10]
MKYTYDYSLLPGSVTTLAPVIPVTFINGKYNFDTFALVDSGADSGLISTVIADALHIDWNKLKRETGYTTSGEFYYRTFKNLETEIEFNPFMIDINIVEGVAPFKCILGRNDLFLKAEITFRGFANQFDIEFRKFN